MTGLLFVQFLLGAYHFSFTVGVDRPESNARASRLPGGVVFTHLSVAIVAAILWFGYEGSHWRPIAWSAFGAFAVGASLGIYMMLRTVGQPATLAETQGGQAEAANLMVAEKQIPGISITLHLLIGVALAVLSLLIAAGVFA